MKTKRYLYTVQLVVEIPDNIDTDGLFLGFSRKDFEGMIMHHSGPVRAKVISFGTESVEEVEPG